MSDVSNQETIPFQEPPESMPTREDRSVFLLIVQGIHVFSIVCAVLGSVPCFIISIPIYYCNYHGIELNCFDGVFWIYLSPFVQMPIALVLYLLGKGLGCFVRNERLLRLSETNAMVFGVCFFLAFIAVFLISVFNGGLSK